MAPLFRRLQSRLRPRIAAIEARLGRDREHIVAPGITIILPADHRLPIYQAEHRLYDRFLPHLAIWLADGDRIIDVGANCGDTLAAMYSARPTLRFVCIEPDKGFDTYLRRNIKRLPGVDAIVVNAMVGQAISGAALIGSGGTAKQVISSGGGRASQTLDELLQDVAAPVRLLKTDVDGFDYDVLDSASNIIARDAPLLFFECYLDHDFQRLGYRATIAALAAKGYTDWSIFDNFGALMAHGGSELVLDILDYVWLQNAGATTRTIFYIDILAATASDKALVSTVLGNYQGCRTA
jgi:FkbM family methyltransferase